MSVIDCESKSYTKLIVVSSAYVLTPLPFVCAGAARHAVPPECSWLLALSTLRVEKSSLYHLK